MSLVTGKKRGRPAKTEARSTTVENTRRRKRDIHGRKRQKLTAPQIPGFFTKFVNDTGTNLAEHYKEDDFEFVRKDEMGVFEGRETTFEHIGEGGDENSDLGNRVRVLVDTDENGNPIYAYLMKKPMEYHQADKQAAEEARRDKEAQLRRGSDQIENQYGSIR